RKSVLPSILKEFEEVQAKIESLAKTTADKISAALEPQVRERESFENNYFEVLAEIDTIVENRNKIQNSASTSSGHDLLTNITSGCNSQANIKLPVLNLPVFAGRYTEWLSFHDAFDSVIHKNQELNACQKMHYLKSSLKGEALQAIES
ncbi:hypothetical protein ILUMI_26402, partial [Ignelater luminosus]